MLHVEFQLLLNFRHRTKIFRTVKLIFSTSLFKLSRTCFAFNTILNDPISISINIAGCQVFMAVKTNIVVFWVVVPCSVVVRYRNFGGSTVFSQQIPVVAMLVLFTTERLNCEDEGGVLNVMILIKFLDIRNI